MVRVRVSMSAPDLWREGDGANEDGSGIAGNDEG